MTNVKKLWLGIGILVLLSPLGIIVPSLFNAGGAWGEWGLNEIRNVAGFVPEGMKHLAEIWKAPLPGYGIPGQGKGLLAESLGYLGTAIIGVAFIVAIMYVVSRLVGRKKDDMK